MAIYDRDWYRNGDNSSSNTDDNKTISRQEAEKIRRMFEGSPERNAKPENISSYTSNEPPKVDPKYKSDFTGKPSYNDNDIEKKVDELIDSIDKKHAQRDNHQNDKIVSKTKIKVSDTGLMIWIFVILFLILFVIFMVTKNDNKSYKNKVSSPVYSQSLSVNAPKQKELQTNNAKQYRLVEHITQDLTPILEKVANTLEYNDISGIKNWIFSEDITNSELGAEIRKMRNVKTINDQNNDSIINCKDFAILFYKLASEAGFDVKIMSNSKLSHAFNSVRRSDGTWETIEPQAGKGGKIIMKNAWKDYDPSFDKDVTEQYRNFLATN